MNKNKYRLIGGIIIFAIIYFLIFFGDKTNFSQAASGLMEDYVVKSSLPTYSFMNDVDKNSSFNLLNSILNDIYPMNEFLTSSNNPDNNPVYIRADDLDDLNNYTVDNNEKQDDPNNAQQQSLADESQIQTQTDQPEPVVNSDMDVISRSVTTGNVYPREQLNDFNNIKSTFFTVTGITSLLPEMLRPSEFLDMDLSVTHDASTPQILIFHTHSQETFVDSEPGNLDTTIVGVGDYLTQVLTEKYGYNVIHDRSVYDYVDGKLDRSKAYTYSEAGAQKILDENPSIEVVIDLHRDGVAAGSGTKFVTNIDGKDMARVMFVNGLSYSNENGPIGYLYNPNRDGNLAMSLQMALLGEAYYPGFLRRNYCNAYRYCLHMRPKSMLIEAGADTNTLAEEKNAMEPLADMMDKLLRGEKVY